MYKPLFPCLIVWEVTELKVEDVMIKNIFTSRGDISLQQAIEILYDKHTGSLIVLDEEGGCEGIFTTRDALRVIACKMDLQTPLSNVMTKRVVTVPEDAPFAHAKNVMIEHRIRHLPVTGSENKIVGIITIRTVFDELIGYPTAKNITE